MEGGFEEAEWVEVRKQRQIEDLNHILLTKYDYPPEVVFALDCPDDDDSMWEAQLRWGAEQVHPPDPDDDRKEQKKFDAQQQGASNDDDMWEDQMNFEAEHGDAWCGAQTKHPHPCLPRGLNRGLVLDPALVPNLVF